MRVPRVATTTGRIPFAPRSPDSTVAAANAVAGAFGAAANVALAKSDFDARREAQAARDEADTASTSFGSELDDLGREVLRGDDIGAIGDTFKEKSEEIQGRIAEGLSSDDAREAFAKSSGRLFEAHRSSVGDAQFKREVAAGKINLTNNLDAKIDSIVVARNPLIREQMIEESVEMIQGSEWLLAENKAPAIENFLANIDLRTITSLIDMADASEDHGEAIGHLDAASELLKSEEGTPGLSSTQRTSLRREVEAEKADAVKRFNVGRTRDLSADITVATTPQEIAAATEGINTLLDEEVISEGQAIGMDRDLQSRTARVDSADSGAAAVEYSIENGIALDPAEQDEYDAYYEEIFLKNNAGRDPADVNDDLIALVGATNMIPSAVEKFMRTAANSDNPELVDNAAQQFEAFRDASPQAVERFDRTTVAFLENVNEAVKLNIPVEQAVKRARETAKLDPSIRQARDDNWRFAQSEETDGDWLVDNINELSIDGGLFFDIFDTNADEVEPGFKGAFSAEVHRQHILDPDIDKSRRRAMDHIKRAWGVTDIGGEPRIQYLSPNLMYPNVTSEEISRQLFAYVRVKEVQEIAGLEDEALSDRLIVAPDADSAREHHPETGVLAPGYNVYLRDSEGDSLVQLLDSDNLPLRFLIEESDAAAQKKADALAEAKKDREISESTKAAQRLSRRGVALAEDLVEIIPGQFTPRRKRRVVEP